MHPRPEVRRTLGIALLVSALVLLGLGLLFILGVFPVAEDARLIVGGAVLLAGTVDAGIGVKFLTSG